MVKNPPAVKNTWVQSPGREDALEKEMATHSSILAWSIPGHRSLAGYSPWGRKESDMTEPVTLSQTNIYAKRNRSRDTEDKLVVASREMEGQKGKLGVWN